MDDNELKYNKKENMNAKVKKKNFSNQIEDKDLLIIKEINHIKELTQNNTYNNLTNNQLKKEIQSRNKIIKLLKEETEKSKKDLDLIIIKLNESISKKAELIFKPKPSENLIEKLGKKLISKQKDLNTSKNINEIFKIKYKLLTNKLKKIISFEEIPNLEKEINIIKKENNSINNKIKERKNKNIINYKESSNIIQKKESSIQYYTNEYKTFINMKFDLMKKLDNNIQLIESEQNLFKKLEKLYNDNINSNENKNIDLNLFNFWFNLIKNDLSGNVNDIILKIDNDKSKFINEIDKINNNKKLLLPLLNKNNINDYLNKSENNIEENLKKNFSNLNLSQRNKKMSSKFSIINQRSESQNKNIKQILFYRNNPIRNLKKSQSTKQLFNNDSFIKYDNNNQITNIYNMTNDTEYKNLLNKKEELLEINSRLNNTMKDLIKISKNKKNNIIITLHSNQKNLYNMKIKNNDFKNEVLSLKKILTLSKQHNLLTKLINKKEKRNSLEKLNQTNEISLTRNEILNELNNIKDEDKKNILNNDDENKNLKFSEFSYVEKNDDDILTDREKKLDKIKNKYLIDLN